MLPNICSTKKIGCLIPVYHDTVKRDSVLRRYHTVKSHTVTTLACLLHKNIVAGSNFSCYVYDEFTQVRAAPQQYLPQPV